MRSLFDGMIAVCGIGRPSGWRNSAVTANQSASPPTSAASAKAFTQGRAGCAASYRVSGDEHHRHGDEQQRRRQPHLVKRRRRQFEGAKRSQFGTHSAGCGADAVSAVVAFIVGEPALHSRRQPFFGIHGKAEARRHDDQRQRGRHDQAADDDHAHRRAEAGHRHRATARSAASRRPWRPWSSRSAGRACARPREWRRRARTPLPISSIAMSTSRIEFLATMPSSISRPMNTGIEIGMPVRCSAMPPPSGASSSEPMLTKRRQHALVEQHQHGKHQQHAGDDGDR